jgi:hypothetical protein
MGLVHHKGMKKRIVIGFFMLLLINFSLEFSINCDSLPESQDNIREWVLLNNEYNSANFSVETSKSMSINYYIEEIEEADHMRYIVYLNFTGDPIQLYGDIGEDAVKNFTIIYVTVFAGDETNIYYELQILNETNFTIPDYIYNFSWNFTSTDPLQFVNLRIHYKFRVTHPAWESDGSGSISLINDSPDFEKDNFKNLAGKINFNINSQQFITDFNISVDFSKEIHTEISLSHNEIDYGDGSVAGTEILGSLLYLSREQILLDSTGWVQYSYYSYTTMNTIYFPYTEVFGVNYPKSFSLNSNDEILNQTDQLLLWLKIIPFLKVDSPLYIYEFVQVRLHKLLYFELDNIDSSQEFFIKYSNIFKFVGVILGITGLVILTKLYLKRRNSQ